MSIAVELGERPEILASSRFEARGHLFDSARLRLAARAASPRLRRVQSWLRRDPPGAIRVRILVKGRVGEGWFDVDRKLALPVGATLAALIEAADRDGLRLSQAIEASPHLRHTLMWNGQRTPVDENLDRELSDGDELYLLGPVAGG
jgi:molybdopterin converting factor small subunit